MKFLEYQAKRVFAEEGIPVPRGEVAQNPEEVKEAAERLGGKVVVKAQVPIGGRGKAGGIAVVDGADEAYNEAERIFSLHIQDYPVEQVLVEEAADIKSEFYLSVTVDRDEQKPVIILSAAGGMDIEEVAETDPDKVIKVWVEPSIGLRPFHVSEAIARVGVDKIQAKQLASFIQKVYAIFKREDAMLVEINPLAILGDGSLKALDGKMETDDNAAYKHPDAEGVDEQAEHPLEQEAKELGLAYVKLDGDVGIVGNGAGLVMTTLDMIKRSGGEAANFLDIGGGAQADVVEKALSHILSDPAVKSVLINIFGGITRCDEVAKGLLAATSNIDVNVPIVVRLAGTRAEEGRQVLEGSSLIPAASFQEAAEKAVELGRVS